MLAYFHCTVIGPAIYIPLVSDQTWGIIGEAKIKVEPGRVGGSTAFTVAVCSDDRREISVEFYLLAIVREVGELLSRYGHPHHECKTKASTFYDGVIFAAFVNPMMLARYSACFYFGISRQEAVFLQGKYKLETGIERLLPCGSQTHSLPKLYWSPNTVCHYVMGSTKANEVGRGRTSIC